MNTTDQPYLAPDGIFTRLKEIDYLPYIVTLLVLATLLVFLVYPITNMLLLAFVKKGQPITLSNVTLANFSRFFTSSLYRKATVNSLFVSLSVVLFSTLIGVLLAYIVGRVDIYGKALLMSLATLPLILPPFVGAYSWIILFGKGGVVNYLLSRYLGLTLPSIVGNFGVIMAMTFSYYPFVFLMTHGALASGDPYLEEAAELMGATSWYKIRTITLPLVLPSIGAGAVTVFMRALGNFGVPAILGGERYVLPTLIFFQITGYFNLHTASAISLVSVMFSLGALLLYRHLLLRSSFATLTTTTRGARVHRGAAAKIAGTIFCYLIVGLSLLPHITVVVAAFSAKWAGTPLPTGFSLDNFRQVFTHSLIPLKNSLVLSTVATSLAVIVGVVVAYTCVRRKFMGRWLLDMIVMLPFILPGIVVGVAILSAFVKPPIVLAGTWMILVVAYFIRRMPYVFRSSSAALSQLDPVLEEASCILGATTTRTLTKVTLPLVTPGILAGALITFTTLIGELSTTMIIYSAKWKTVTVAIYEYLLEDVLGPACALGTIVIVVVLGGIMLANRLLGQRISNMFGMSG